jgi:hypothetical protein
MKMFGFNFGSKSDEGNLSADQVSLKGALLPYFKQLRERGYSLKEAGFALRDHFERTQETITMERAVEVLQDPEKMIFTYRTANNKPNRPTFTQSNVLSGAFRKAEDKAKAIDILARHFVVDAIPAVRFKGIVQQLAACKCQPTLAQIAQWKN